MLQKIFFKILCFFVLLNNCYAPGNYVPADHQDPHFNELPCSNGENRYYASSRESFTPFGLEPLGVNNNPQNQIQQSKEGLIYTPNDDVILSNNRQNIKQYSFESLRVLNEEALSDIVTLLKNLNSSIFEGFDDTVLIDQCFQKISKLDKCHIQISCGILLLYLNNLKRVRNETISVFAVDYYNFFIKNADEEMSNFYRNLKIFIDSHVFDFSLIENNSFLNDSFKRDIESLLFHYRNLFSTISSSNLFHFSSKGFCLICDKALSNKKNSDFCMCSFNEKKAGFHYKDNEKVLFEYEIANEQFLSVFLKDRPYKFLGYGYDIWGNVFIAIEQECVCYFVPVGLVSPGPKIIVYDDKLFFVSNESDYFAYRSVNNLREIGNTCEKVYNYKLFKNKLNLLFDHNLFFILMICIPIFTIMFFILFCVNWSDNCHNCGNPAVKFLGGLFNFLFGMEVSLFVGEFIFNFKNLITSDSVIRYAASINNSFCTIRKIIRSKMAGNLIFNNILVIVGSIVGGLLAIWPFIWFVVIEALNERLVSGVSFIAGLSLLFSGFCLGSIIFYLKRYKEVKNILKYDIEI